MIIHMVGCFPFLPTLESQITEDKAFVLLIIKWSSI